MLQVFPQVATSSESSVHVQLLCEVLLWAPLVAHHPVPQDKELFEMIVYHNAAGYNLAQGWKQVPAWHCDPCDAVPAGAEPGAAGAEPPRTASWRLCRAEGPSSHQQHPADQNQAAARVTVLRSVVLRWQCLGVIVLR